MISRIIPGLTELGHKASKKWNAFWFSGLPSAGYSLFRVFHGLTLLLFLAAWWQHAPEWIGSAGFHFPDELVPPLPFWALPFFAILQFGTLILLVAGWKIRTMATLSWLCLCYVTLADRISAFSINNIYLFTLIVFAVYPGATRRRNLMTAIPVRILQVAMVAIYFSSGWHKAVFGDWLDSPTVLQSVLSGIYMTDSASWAMHTFAPPFWTLAQYLSLAFELFSPVLFCAPRLRWLAIAFGCAFHLGIALFMDQLIYFSLQMMSFYILFIPWNTRTICSFYSMRIPEPER